MNFLFAFLKKRILRKPDFIVGTAENPYLLRWHIIPRNRFFNIYLHKFLRDDDDRALHDHPWASCSIILKSGYLEYLPRNGLDLRFAPMIIFRKATQAHRVKLWRDRAGKAIPAWTLFITGPRVREWGFHCPKGWRHWKEFTNPENSGEVGRGCE